jgi:DNA invertase Pin-like site-specific DNA recombinase
MANILAGVAAYETEVRAERILAGQTAARERGIHWGGSRRGRRIKVTVESIAVIRRLRSEGATVAAIARATGLSRPTVDRILSEDCQASTGSGDVKPDRRIDCGTGPM